MLVTNKVLRSDYGESMKIGFAKILFLLGFSTIVLCSNILQAFLDLSEIGY